jgi:hypothetical protein
MKCLAMIAFVTGCLATAGVKAQESPDYAIYPVDRTIQRSSDGRYWVMDLVDTEGNRGTLSIDAQSGAYDAIWAGVPETGTVDAGTHLVEVPAASGGSGGGSGCGDAHCNVETYPGSGAAGTDGVIFVVGGVSIAWAACSFMHRNGAKALTRMYDACLSAGGSPSGGSVGFCGGVTAPVCHRP